MLRDKANYGKGQDAKRLHAVSPAKIYLALGEEIGKDVTAKTHASGETTQKQVLSPKQKKLVKNRLSSMMVEDMIEHPMTDSSYYSLVADVTPAGSPPASPKPKTKKTPTKAKKKTPTKAASKKPKAKTPPKKKAAAKGKKPHQKKAAAKGKGNSKGEKGEKAKESSDTEGSGTASEGSQSE